MKNLEKYAQLYLEKTSAPEKKKAAGFLFISPRDKEIFLVRRSKTVDTPGHWCTVGGGVEKGENFLEAAKREVVEELGSLPEIADILDTVDSSLTDDFVYKTFLAVVSPQTRTDWRPKMNPENDKFGWFKPDALPKPLHPGLAYTLKVLKERYSNKQNNMRALDGVVKEAGDVIPFRRKKVTEKDDSEKEEPKQESGDVIPFRVKRVTEKDDSEEPKQESEFLQMARRWARGDSVNDIFGYAALNKRLARMQKATHNKFSITTLRNNIKLVEQYSNDELRHFVFDTSETDWVVKPSFYHAVFIEAKKRLFNKDASQSLINLLANKYLLKTS